MKIDSHQHFLKPDRRDYFWMTPEVPILYRDYLPEDLRPILKRHGIDKTVLVQATQTVAETDFLLDLAKTTDFVGGVVGWLDMEAHDFPRRLERYCQNSRFIGLRPMLESLPDDDWILRRRVIESLKLVPKANIVFELLTTPQQLPHTLKAIDAVPDLPAVIDHISKPDIKNRKTQPWKDLIREAASNKNVCCKLSGLVSVADHEKWTVEDLRPYVDHIVECFGLQRVMYGSDWPVCLRAGTYDQVIGAIQTLLKPYLDETSEAAVFGGNAARVYRLNRAAHNSIAGP